MASAVFGYSSDVYGEGVEVVTVDPFVEETVVVVRPVGSFEDVVPASLDFVAG